MGVRTKRILRYAAVLLLMALTTSPVLSVKETEQQNEQARGQAKVTHKLNVLLLTTAVSMGHVAPLLAVGEELVRRGHSVSICTTYPPNKEETVRKMAEKVGVRYIGIGPSSNADNTNVQESEEQGFSGMFLKIQQEMGNISKFVFEKLIGDPIQRKKWDIVVYADFLHFVATCIYKRHNIPIIMVSTVPQMYSNSEPNWPWPSIFLGDVSDDMSFLDRFKVLLFRLVLTPLLERVSIAQITKPILEYCPDFNFQQLPYPYVPEIYPTVIGFEYSRVIWPLTSYVGPLLSKTLDPLPQELELWLEKKREKSVIYISMGSHVNLPVDAGHALIQGILNTEYSAVWALRKVNQNILEGVSIDTQRFFIIEWAPQLSILQHKTIGMAVVHGGFNGVHEALYNGVPLIVVPLIANFDQPGNAGRIRHQGLGVQLDLNSITAEAVTNSINEIELGDYRKNVESIQKLFIFAGGVEKAADLVEYYKDVGFDHLIPGYAKYEWSWIQYYNVDVYCLLLVILVTIIYCSMKCCQCVCRTCCRKTAKDKKD